MKHADNRSININREFSKCGAQKTLRINLANMITNGDMFKTIMEKKSTERHREKRK